MAERPEDLNLPITVVQRIIKEALPDGVIVSKEARQTICRASSVFVLYLTSCAVTHANKAKRKTLAVNDILSAINDMEFDSFTQPLQDILKFRKENTSSQANKKQNKKNAELSKDEEGEVEVEEEEEVDDGNGEEDENEQNTNEDEPNEDENDEEKENANERKVKKRKTENKGGSNTNQEETEEAEENQNENESEEDSSASENEMN